MLVGYETGYSQLGATRLVGYLPFISNARSWNNCYLEFTNHFKVERLQIIVVAKKYIHFKADRLQMIVVAKKIYIYISVLPLFISRMPKMYAILQLVSAPLNPKPTAEHFRRSHPQCEPSYGQHTYMSEENNAK